MSSYEIGSMKTKILIINIIASLFVVMIFLIALTFILFHYQSSPTALKDSWSTVGSFFGGIATLTAAYVASLLFNDWRFEKDHETKSIYLNNAIQKLSEIHSSLIESRSNANNLLKINNCLILNTDYLNQMSINHKKTLTLLHADLTVVSKLFDKHTLMDKYFIYEKFINVFDIFNELLSKKYRTYYYYYINEYSPDKKNDHLNIFNLIPLGTTTDPTHTINQNNVFKFLNNELGRLIDDKKESCTYLDHIKECLDAHEIITNECILELKAKHSI